jgi:Rps23 Pro-64 3,4-dihydroxylase Tpa1-like proline 4-hydroxylase
MGSPKREWKSEEGGEARKQRKIIKYLITHEICELNLR